MALGAVAPEIPGADYALWGRNKNQTVESVPVSETQQTQSGERSTKPVIFQYDNGTDCLLTARYAPESTENNPVMQVTVNRGGKEVCQKVAVNEVNPQNATQLELFALLSYHDDKNGTSNLYQKLDNYAKGAQQNGIWEGNDTLEEFTGTRYNWADIQNSMDTAYYQAGFYSMAQYGSELCSALSKYSMRFFDFENITFENRSSKTFHEYHWPEFSEKATSAWYKAAEESGLSDFGNSDYDMEFSTRIFRNIIRRVEEMTQINPGEVADSCVLAAVKEALAALDYPQTEEMLQNEHLQEEISKQRAFYESFIRNMEENTYADSTVADTEETEKTYADLQQFIKEYMEQLLEKIKNGDTEASFQIGGRAYTVREWDKLLEEFDAVQDEIKKLIREQIAKRMERAKESAATGNASLNMITASTVQARFPLQETDENNNPKEDVYLTAIDHDGIRCCRPGSDEYEWELKFSSEAQYEQVSAFMEWANDHMDNFLFSAHENFWQDFLDGNMDLDAFQQFLPGTNNGIPDYGITKGDSMYIDESKIQWAKYMNHPGARFYTAEEMAQMLAAEIAKNQTNLTKLPDWFHMI